MSDEDYELDKVKLQTMFKQIFRIETLALNNPDSKPAKVIDDIKKLIEREVEC